VKSFLGIAREPVYSPGKVGDDRAILDEVAARLRRRGHQVRVVDPTDAPSSVDLGTIVFAMCQGPRALAALEQWSRAGVRIVNTPQAIADCHRLPTLEAFARRGIRHPESLIVATDGSAELPDWLEKGAWLKRSDVHAVEANDVVRLEDNSAAARWLASFATRGIGTAVLQRHVEGDVIKFYAVRGGFFAAFPGEGARELAPDDERAMRELAARGADALGLEVFGGDVVRERSGVFTLIDLNDWPSYGRCRARGADAISSYLDAQTE